MPPFVRTLIEAVVGLVAIALIWTIAAWVVDSPVKLPTLSSVLAKASALARSDDYLRHATDSGTALLLGLLPALVAGVLVGVIAGLSPAMRWLFGPLAVTLAGAPLVVLLPVFVVWWGVTMTTKAVTVFVVAAFPIVNMVAMETSRSRARSTAGANRPASGGAAPIACAILASLRLGVVLGMTALVVTEFAASTRGVGYFIMNSAGMFDMSATMAGIVLVVVPTVLVAALLQAIEEQVAG